MRKFLKNILKYRKYAFRSAKAELKSEVADSRLNWLWWIIEPLSFMLIYTFVFSIVFPSKIPFFACFVMVGQAAWSFFSRMLSGSVKLIVNNIGLVTKVYIPKYILLLTKSMTYVFKMAIEFFLVLILMFIQGISFSWKITFIIPIIIVLYIVCFGAGMILMHMGVKLSDLSNLTNILLKMVFYLSGIFYDITERLNGIIGFILSKINPIGFCISELRNVMIYDKLPDFFGLIIWLVTGCALCVIGMRAIHRNENNYAKVI